VGGIGRAIVDRFLSEGASVVISDIKQEAVDECARGRAERAAGVVVDVRIADVFAAGRRPVAARPAAADKARPPSR
jgi:NAD(P)-dependent dehydrogenase (short-subunit alcohol dehydrogenase family)